MAAMPDKKPEVFVRKASGLIRTAGTWDVLAYNINFTSIGLLLLFLFLFGPAFYPGASLPWAAVICTLLILPLAMVYGYLASAMPRSGGDYVYVSRVLGPALGMMSNWNMTMWWFFYGGVPSAFLARYGLAPFFRTMGIYTGNTTLTSIGNWFTTKVGTFILGTCLIILLIVVFAIGTKTYFKIQNILILFAVASTVLTVAVFIGKVPVDSIHAFNAHMRAVSGKAMPSAVRGPVGQGGRLHRALPLLAVLDPAGDDLGLPEPLVHELVGLHRQRGQRRPPAAAVVDAGDAVHRGRRRARQRARHRPRRRLQLPGAARLG